MSKSTMNLLSKNDIEKVHQSALRILEEVGVKIDSFEVLEMLSRAGAKIDHDRQIAFLGERMVSQALKSVPKTIRVASRRGVDYEIPHEGVQLISPDGQPPAIFDVSKSEKRPSTLKDVINLAILADALPQVGFVWPPVIATDMPPERSSLYEFLATIAYTSKHVQHGATSTKEANFQIDVAAAILGSKEELRGRPIFSDVCTPISPLRYDKGEAEAMVVLSRAGVPMVQLSMAIAGTATPVTVAGSVAIVNAENLCGLTITQVANPGAPSIYSSFSGVSDLKTGVYLSGTPEGLLMEIAGIEMAKYYRLPSCIGGPSNSARSLSAESAYQTAMCTTASILAGSDLMVGLGGLDRAAMISPEKLTMDCEIWRWLERLRAGITIDDETLGFDAIKRQGPGGSFISDPHTLSHMRKDLLIPQFTSYHESGKPDFSKDELVEYAKRRTRELLATHKPPLFDKDVAERVGRVAKNYGVLLKDGKQIFEHA